MMRAAPHSRLGALDSIRGIAAFLVVLYHCWAAAGAREQLALIAAPSFWAPGSAGNLALRSVAGLFEMGRAAVMMFFVLSGFVLAGSLLSARVTYLGFEVKRVLRIYPAFVVAILASYALHHLIGSPHPGQSVLLARIEAPDLSPVTLLGTLALWGTRYTLDLDLAVWSLVHEMRISLLFPLLLLALRRTGAATLAICALLSPLCALGLHAATGRITYGFMETTGAQTLAVTGYFLVFFAAGAWLAIERQRIARWLGSAPPAVIGAGLAVCCLVLLKGDHGAESLSTILVDYAHGLASWVIVALVIVSPAVSRALAVAALLWLGRISYSLYLVHLPVIYVLSQLLPHASRWLSAALAVGASLLLAQALARGVEVPFMRIGHRIAQRLHSARQHPAA